MTNSDYAQAMIWFQKAAENGYIRAYFELGDGYEGGLVFHTPEGKRLTFEEAYIKGASWYRKAAEAGDRDAQVALGGLYFHGRGVPQNYAEAYYWLSLSYNPCDLWEERLSWPSLIHWKPTIV